MILARNIFVQYRSVQGEKYVALNHNVYQLDEVGVIVWESLDGKTSLTHIVEKIAEKYNVDKEIVLKDVNEFVNDLLEKNLGEEVG